MKSTLEKLNEIKNYGYSLDFGQALEQTFENYKKIILVGAAVMLVFVVLMYASTIGIIGITYGMGGLANFTSYEQPSVSTTAIITTFFLSVGIYSILAPLQAGMLKIAHNAESYKEFSFSTAFEYYKGKEFKEIIIASVLVVGFNQLMKSGTDVLFPVTFGYDDNFLLIRLIPSLVGLLVTYLTFMMIPLIIFGGLNATQAIRGSIIIVSKRFFIILLLCLVCTILACLGMIGICIGVLFTLPVIFSMQYIIYRTAIGIDEKDELDEIGYDHESY